MEKHTFKVENQLVAIDPCYNVLSDGTVFDAVPGTWSVFTATSDEGVWGKRIAEIQIQHESVGSYVPYNKTLECAVAVDSGQAGFYNVSKFVGRDADEGLYDRVCDGTLSKERVYSDEHGAFSSSGFGDGCYQLHLSLNDEGKAVAAKIVFIGDEWEEEDDDWEEEDYEEEEDY